VALFVLYTIQGINLVLMYGGALLGVFCVIDAALRRPDAFVAADKLTKGTWFGILVACGVVLGLAMVEPQIFAPQGILWLAALIGVMVYLCDVRPNVKRVTGGHRW
jgi:predicted tellurium resistance membrane protein TerC